VQQCVAALERTLAYGRRYRLRFTEANANSVLGLVSILRGDLAAARRYAAEAAAPWEAQGQGVYAAVFSGYILMHCAVVDGAEPDPLRLAPSPDVTTTVEPFRALQNRASRALAAMLAREDGLARSEVAAIEQALLRYGGFEHATAAGEALIRYGSQELVEALYTWVVDSPQRLFPLSSPFDWLRGALAVRLGMPEAAKLHFNDGLELCRREKLPFGEGLCLEGLADIAEQRGEHDLAMEHLDTAGDLYSRFGATRYLNRVIARKEILKA